MGGFCCKVPPEPRVALSGYCKCLVIIGIYRFGPITAVPCREKTTPLPRTSILFHPHKTTHVAKIYRDMSNK